MKDKDLYLLYENLIRKYANEFIRKYEKEMENISKEIIDDMEKNHKNKNINTILFKIYDKLNLYEKIWEETYSKYYDLLFEDNWTINFDNLEMAQSAIIFHSKNGNNKTNYDDNNFYRALNQVSYSAFSDDFKEKIDNIIIGKFINKYIKKLT